MIFINPYKLALSIFLMNIKTKKFVDGRVVRLETSGEIKEIIINEDFLKQDKASIAICFRGEKSSGILELSQQEFENISRDVGSKANLLKGVKVMKFRK
jgi:hypothetical protein